MSIVHMKKCWCDFITWNTPPPGQTQHLFSSWGEIWNHIEKKIIYHLVEWQDLKRERGYYGMKAEEQLKDWSIIIKRLGHHMVSY